MDLDSVDAKSIKNKRRVGIALDPWEIPVVSALLAKQDKTDQGILSFFTRPTRSVNLRLIGQIRKGTAYNGIPIAWDGDLAESLATWPDIDTQTGLSLRGDELPIKAREAMIAAVHTFNGAGLHSRAEPFMNYACRLALTAAGFARLGTMSLGVCLLPPILKQVRATYEEG